MSLRAKRDVVRSLFPPSCDDSDSMSAEAVGAQPNSSIDPLPWKRDLRPRTCRMRELQAGGRLCEGTQHGERTGDARLDKDSQVLDALGHVLEWGWCVECSTTWRWEQEDGTSITISAAEPHPADPTGTDATTASADERCLALHSLERWILEHAPVPFDACDLLAQPSVADGTPMDGEAPAVQEQSSARHASCEGHTLVEQAAAAEDGHCDVGCASGERLGHTAWWADLRARVRGATPTLVLAIMAAENAWIWKLPWTPAFRVHLSHALFAVQAAAVQPVFATAPEAA